MEMNIAQEMDMPLRGRHRAGKGRRKESGYPDPHAAVKEHIKAAQATSDPKVAHQHLFKAISALKKCG